MSNDFQVITITHLFYPHVGGIETSAKNLLEFLTKNKGLKCAIFYCSRTTNSFDLEGISCFPQKSIIILKGLYPIATFKYTLRLLNHLKSNPDAKVIIFGRHLTTSLIGAFLCRLLKRKYIYVDSGFQPDIFKSKVLNKFVNSLDRLLFKKVVKWSKFRIIISKYTFNIFKKQFPQIAENISVINNGFSEEIINKFEKIEKENNVVWASRISEIKDPKTVIKAYKELAVKYNDWKFYLIGKGDFEFDLEEYKTFKNIVIFPRLLPQLELLELLNRSAIYINSSFSEGMSVAVLEAAALGCIPVLSDADSNVEIAGKLGTKKYVFERGNSGRLTEVLTEAIENFDQKNANAISEKAFKNFSSEVVFEKYFELMEKLPS